MTTDKCANDMDGNILNKCKYKSPINDMTYVQGSPAPDQGQWLSIDEPSTVKMLLAREREIDHV